MPPLSPEQVDVLIPTRGRPLALAATLATLIGQTHRHFDLVVSDQSEDSASFDTAETRSILRLLQARGHGVRLCRNLPRRGPAQQCQFLLGQTHAPYVLFLDDDVLLEPDLLERLLQALRSSGAGFVGSAVIGLSGRAERGSPSHAPEFWEGPVQPEELHPGMPAWEARRRLHDAGHLWHAQQRLCARGEGSRLYKVAWTGGCVMYDAARLREVGGFGAWQQEQPEQACGEDVRAQLRVMARFGGCGLMPSGAYQQERQAGEPARLRDEPGLRPEPASSTRVTASAAARWHLI